MGWGRRLFDFRGRAGRLEYWRFQIIAGLALAVILFLTWGVVMAGGPGLLPFLLAVPLLVANAAVIVRRLHDRGHSGWLGIFMVLLPAVLGLAAEDSPAAALLGFGLSLWAFVELGCLKGKPGANDFGVTLPTPSLFAERRS